MGLTWWDGGSGSGALGLLIWAQTPHAVLDKATIIRWVLWLLVGFFGIFPGIVAYMVWLERRSPPAFRTGSAPTGLDRWVFCSRSLMLSS